MLFADRSEAGRRLAEKLTDLRGQDVVVVGLPRGGVPVAAEVAKSLEADLDVIVVRKLGVPYQPELAFGAVGEDGVPCSTATSSRLSRGQRSSRSPRSPPGDGLRWQQCAQRFRGRQARLPLGGRTVVIVDDGIATGATARAACQVARAQGAERVVLGVPVAPLDTEVRLRTDADEVVCLHASPDFFAVGQFYRDFHQVPDDAVIAPAARRSTGCPARAAASAVVNEDVLVRRRAGAAGRAPDGAGARPGDRGVRARQRQQPAQPAQPARRGRAEPGGLGARCCSTCSPPRRKGNATYVFDVELLARRFTDATTWLHGQADVRELPIGLFGASTGAAAALWAAADPWLAGGAPSSPAAGGRTWPPHGCRRCGSDAAHRRRPRRAGAAAEPAGAGAAALPEPAGGRAGGDASVRGAGDVGRGRSVGRRLVRRPPGRCGAAGGVTIMAPGAFEAGPRLVAGRAHPALAEAVATGLRVRPVPAQGERFPDGELRPTAGCVRDCDVYVLAPTGPPVNDNLVELLLLLDACRRGGAARPAPSSPIWATPVRTGAAATGRRWACAPSPM